MKRKILTKNFDATSNDVECGMFSIIYTNWLFENHYIIFKDLFDGDMNWFPPRFRKWLKMWISMPHKTVCDLQKIADANKITLKHFAKNQCHCMMTLTKKLCYIQALSRIYGMASVLSNLSVLDW